jgi:hypothetical protein
MVKLPDCGMTEISRSSFQRPTMASSPGLPAAVNPDSSENGSVRTHPVVASAGTSSSPRDDAPRTDSA